MEGVISAWGKLPAIVRGIICGVVVMYIGIFAYELLEILNAEFLPDIRWAPFAMIPLLWLYWNYFSGRWWPAATSEARREAMKPELPARNLWGWVVLASVGAGVFALNFSYLWQRIIGVHLPSERFVESGVPAFSQVATMVMIAAVAGMCEEVGARGYLQSIVQKRHGAAIAIFFSALIFALVHFNHPWGPAMAGGYFIVSIWFGLLTYVSGSVVPMVLVHFSINSYAFLTALFFGPRPLDPPLAQSGADPQFWFNFGLVAGATLVMTIAMLKIARGNGLIGKPVAAST